MGIYDGYNLDPDMMNKGVIAMFVFSLVLTLVFVIAKIAGAIAWGWLWVFCPIWGPMALGFVLMLLGVRPPGR